MAHHVDGRDHTQEREIRQQQQADPGRRRGIADRAAQSPFLVSRRRSIAIHPRGPRFAETGNVPYATVTVSHANYTGPLVSRFGEGTSPWPAPPRGRVV